MRWMFVIPTSLSNQIFYTWTDSIGNIISTTTSINNLCSGTYKVTIVDSLGCLSDTTFTIGQILIYGCTDPTAVNYYSAPVNTDDGSCIWVKFVQIQQGHKL